MENFLDKVIPVYPMTREELDIELAKKNKFLEVIKDPKMPNIITFIIREREERSIR